MNILPSKNLQKSQVLRISQHPQGISLGLKKTEDRARVDPAPGPVNRESDGTMMKSPNSVAYLGGTIAFELG